MGQGGGATGGRAKVAGGAITDDVDGPNLLGGVRFSRYCKPRAVMSAGRRRSDTQHMVFSAMDVVIFRRKVVARPQVSAALLWVS
jgi:hypothetical protein